MGKVGKAGGKPAPRIGRNRQIPAKKCRGSYVPIPQRERIRQLHVLGKSISEISRQEGRHRDTVAKIVKAADWPKFVLQMQERFYAFVLPALDGLMRGIEARNVKVASETSWKVLDRAGIVPPKVVTLQQGNTMTQMPEDEAKKLILMRLLEGVLERKEIYGGKLPEDLEERHQKALEEVKKLNMQRERA